MCLFVNGIRFFLLFIKLMMENIWSSNCDFFQFFLYFWKMKKNENNKCNWNLITYERTNENSIVLDDFSLFKFFHSIFHSLIFHHFKENNKKNNNFLHFFNSEKNEKIEILASIECPKKEEKKKLYNLFVCLVIRNQIKWILEHSFIHFCFKHSNLGKRKEKKGKRKIHNTYSFQFQLYIVDYPLENIVNSLDS